MTDRELLELAAKAAGIVGSYSETHPEFGDDWVDPGVWYTDEYDCTTSWNPLTDDGDALRLAVALKIDIHQRVADPRVSAVAALQKPMIESCDDSTRLAATRRAIVRAAAEIGRLNP